jgi:heat-inducible transcriptional repressor
MSEVETKSSLSPRDREILRDIVLGFIGTGEPVSSRALAKLRHHGVSPATIRNVMADLEEMGLLMQPHTSAGRVPTASGYHLFIETLMEARELGQSERRYIDERLRAGDSADGLIGAATHLLTELSGQAAVALTPALGETVLKAIDFVPLSDHQVLCIVVSASGFVDSKPIEIEQPVPREELVRIANYLTENFAGLTLREIRDRLLRLMAEERAQVDSLLSRAIDLGRKSLGVDGAPGVRVDGAALLLAKPELASIERVRRLLDAFEDKARLVRILNRCLDGRGLRVFIGEDSELTSELDFSLVATSYGGRGRPLGTLGIFGPSRMEYPRLIPLVHYLGQRLGQVLGGGEE